MHLPVGHDRALRSRAPRKAPLDRLRLNGPCGTGGFDLARSASRIVSMGIQCQQPQQHDGDAGRDLKAPVLAQSI